MTLRCAKSVIGLATSISAFSFLCSTSLAQDIFRSPLKLPTKYDMQGGQDEQEDYSPGLFEPEDTVEAADQDIDHTKYNVAHPTLLGTIYSNNSKHSIATFNTGSSRIGGVLFGHSIIDILPKRVFLRHGTRTYEMVPGDSLGDTKAPVDTSKVNGYPMETSGDVIRVTRQYITGEKLSNILMQVTATPIFRDWQLDGVLFDNMDSGSLFERFGFQNGDIVTELDDIKLTGLIQAVQLIKNLRNSEHLIIGLLRNGKAKTLNIIIK